MNIILFGPPGAGKGTQADNIVKSFDLHKVSTGDLLRTEISRKTNLGSEIKSIMLGEIDLVEDSISYWNGLLYLENSLELSNNDLIVDTETRLPSSFNDEGEYNDTYNICTCVCVCQHSETNLK